MHGSCRQQFNASISNHHLMQMFSLSESLIYYINALHSNGAVLSRLRNHGEEEHFSAEILGLIDDLIIENHQCYKQAEIYSNVFSGLIDARGNLMNNSMNNLLRKLTLINVVFLPLNLIASIGGVSEFSMMTAGTPWWVSYPIVPDSDGVGRRLDGTGAQTDGGRDDVRGAREYFFDKPARHRLFDWLCLQGQHFKAIRRHRHRVLPLRRQAVVLGHPPSSHLSGCAPWNCPG